jgi:hypothetical protein
MTHAEAIDFSLSLAGGIGVGASITVTLIGFDGGDLEWSDGLRLFGIGILSLLAARPETAAPLQGKKPARRPPH